MRRVLLVHADSGQIAGYTYVSGPSNVHDEAWFEAIKAHLDELGWNLLATNRADLWRAVEPTLPLDVEFIAYFEIPEKRHPAGVKEWRPDPERPSFWRPKMDGSGPTPEKMEPFIYAAISDFVMMHFLEDTAKFITGSFSVHRLEYRTIRPLYVSALMSIKPEAYEKYIPRETWYGRTAEEASSNDPLIVLGINGQLYSTKGWPPPFLKQVDTFYRDLSDPEHYKESINHDQEESIVNMATMAMSSLHDILEVWPGFPEGTGDEPSYLDMEKLKEDSSEIASDYQRKITEDYYLKWWNRYGQEDEKGTYVRIPMAADITIWTKKE